MEKKKEIFPYIAKLLNGEKVQYKTLGEVAEIKRGQRVTKQKLSDDKQYPVYSGGIKPMGYYDSYNQEANTITIVKYGTAGYVNFITEKFWANDVCYCIKPFAILENKYLLYVLKNMQVYINSLATDAIPAHLPAPSLKSIQIPLPPLSVQQEIVRILDIFTQLEAELEAELDCRKRQYEYYRNALLSFDDLENRGGYNSLINNKIQYKTLGEVATYSDKRIKASSVEENNYIGVENLLQNKAGKIISNYVPSEGNVTAYNINDVLIGNIRPYLKKIWLADNNGGASGDVLVIHLIDNSVNAKYLYHILADDKFFNYNMKYAKGAKMPRGDKQKIMDYPIPIPPIEEQERIVAILDKFDTLVNSISEGLPKEIQQRRQQYEYYREKLLTFER